MLQIYGSDHERRMAQGRREPAFVLNDRGARNRNLMGFGKKLQSVAVRAVILKRSFNRKINKVNSINSDPWPVCYFHSFQSNSKEFTEWYQV